MVKIKKTRKTPRPKRRLSLKSENGEEQVVPEDIPEYLPTLPAKDIVAFPSVMMSLYVGRSASVVAIEAAMQKDNLIFIVSQSNQETEDPANKDLFRVGVIANIIRTLKLPDGRYKVLLQGIMRAKAISFKQKTRLSQAYLAAKIKALPMQLSPELGAEEEGIINRIKENLQVLVQYEHLPEEMLIVTEELDDPGVLADVIMAHYKLEVPVAQNILEELDPIKRLRATDSIIGDDLNRFIISENIKDKARDELSKDQREHYLREQIKQINRELGEGDSTMEDIKALRIALDKAKMPKHAMEESMKQYSRLERMHPESSEYALLRTYLDWMVELPWSVTTKDRLDLDFAKTILNKEHFGLEKIKDRILEYLSVRKLNPQSKGSILCFVGPPGVGKTSLGKSIAHALGRKYFRMSLGGVKDEAEIRGHRRTYVGALPGRIVQGLKQTGSRNSVFVLDELDKLGADFRGDPASALLEVLDPQQNREFRDHYLNVNFDLSDMIFVATANTIDTIPEALLDRLEVIYLSGYTSDEKINIARSFLIPRQLKENGLSGKKLDFDNDALSFVIERYTREAGVRNLERELGSLCRKIARDFAEHKNLVKHVSVAVVKKLLGSTKFDPETSERKDSIGISQGLAWTVHGGELMPVEASVAKGKGALTMTGQLGSVMQESAQAALFYARAHAHELGLDPEFHDKFDIHIHVPGGATPKDGPSAGITIASAVVSALSQRKVSKDVAMTGEITLSGNILAVGGLKEKALAALRYGIKKVIIPFDNIKDIDDIPKEQRERIKFIPVKHISEVLRISLAHARVGKANARMKSKKVKPAVSAEI